MDPQSLTSSWERETPGIGRFFGKKSREKMANREVLVAGSASRGILGFLRVWEQKFWEFRGLHPSWSFHPLIQEFGWGIKNLERRKNKGITIPNSLIFGNIFMDLGKRKIRNDRSTSSSVHIPLFPDFRDPAGIGIIPFP